MRRFIRSSSILAAGTLVGVLVATGSALAITTYACPEVGATASTVRGSTCYAYFAAEKSWDDAKTSCEGIGGFLVTISNQSENDAVHSIRLSSEPWIGASDDEDRIAGTSEGNHFWLNGTLQQFWTGGQGGSAMPSTYANWSTPTNEPNNAMNEDCVQIYASGQWNDRDCSLELAYVCELQATATDTGESSNGGSRGNAFTRQYDESLQRLPLHTAAPALTESEQRICDRVLKWFRNDAKMLARVNERIMKRFGFECH